MGFYYVGSIPVSDELYHHGIKGQKWGIRRYQNEDGTLTAAGKERYRKDTVYSDYDLHTNKRYQKRLDKSMDYSNLTKKEKAKKELDVLKRWSIDPEDYDKLTRRQRHETMRVQELIREKSGDWYNMTPVSMGFRRKLDEYTKASDDMIRLIDRYTTVLDNGKIKLDGPSYVQSEEYKEIRKKMQKLGDQLAGVALRDIGFEDTKKAREYVKQMIFWD